MKSLPAPAPSLGAQVMRSQTAMIDWLSGNTLRQTQDMLNGHRPDGGDLCRLIAVWHQALDEAVDVSLAELASQGRRPGCRQGCAWCCYQETLVSSVEVAFLAAMLPPDQHATLAERCRTIVARTAGGGSRARASKTIPCPLLHGTTCSIHAIRPQACRTHFSVSREACRREWNSRTRPERPGAAGGVPMPAQPKGIGFAMGWGLDKALAETGLEVELCELAEGLTVALGPGALDRWLAGERVFRAVARRSGEHLYSELLARETPLPEAA